MNCSICKNFVFDHLDSLSLKEHPLSGCVRLKQFRKYLPSFLIEFHRFLHSTLPIRWSLMPAGLPIDQRIMYENAYLEALENHSIENKKEVETLTLFLLEHGIIVGKSPIVLLLGRQFLAHCIVYFLEQIPQIHDLHKPTIRPLFLSIPLQNDEENLYY